MKKLIAAKASLEQTRKQFNEIFGEAGSSNILEPASKLLDYEIEKAESRSKFAGKSDDEIQAEISAEREKSIEEMQAEAAAKLQALRNPKQVNSNQETEEKAAADQAAKEAEERAAQEAAEKAAADQAAKKASAKAAKDKVAAKEEV